VLSLLLRDRENWPGQEVSDPPVVKMVWVGAYTPWLFQRQVSVTSMVPVPLHGPITDGNKHLRKWSELVDPLEGVVVTPHCYVRGNWLEIDRGGDDWSQGDSVGFLAAVDVNR
jgi:hypothetical protein